jgi:hypothetical protein
MMQKAPPREVEDGGEIREVSAGNRDCLPGHTSQELQIVKILTRRRVMTEMVPTCGGGKTVIIDPVKREKYKPSYWDDLNPKVQKDIRDSIASWQHVFETRGRKRVLEVSLIAEYPLGSGYFFKIIARVRKDGVEIVHPFRFKWSTASMVE